MTYHRPCRHKYYWMTCQQFDLLYDQAGGRCQICDINGTETAHGFLMIDHDVAVGAHGVRGLLCCSCNTLLQRGVAFSEAAARYLESPWWQVLDLQPLRSRRDLSLPPEQILHIRNIVAGRTR